MKSTLLLLGVKLEKLLKKGGRNEGFTLVELMVVVAIIGILSVVAIPNFKQYQAKSKTSEAKIQLSGMYTAMSAFYSDNDVYATCLRYMGYDPSSDNSRYYTVGFSATFYGSGVPGPCTAATGNIHQYAAKNGTGGSTSVVGNLSASAVAVTNAFTLEANGYIESNHTTASTADLWRINETKDMTHVRMGY